MHYSSFIELGWKVTYVGEQAHHTKFPFNFFLGFCHFLFPNLQFLGFWKKNSWEAYSCPLFVCWLFSLGTSFLMHKLNVPILVLWKGIILFFSYKKWIEVRKQRDCSGSSVNANLFYKSYIVYNSIVGWPTINKKKINVMLHFGIVVVKHFSFYKSKTFRFISCFHSITFKNQCFLHFYFCFSFQIVCLCFMHWILDVT